jgi:GT2 family glycosyltransferase
MQNRSELHATREQLHLLRQELRARRQQERSNRAAMEANQDALRAEKQAIATKLAEVEQVAARQRIHLDAIYASTSWRVTAPLRALVDSFRRRARMTSGSAAGNVTTRSSRPWRVGQVGITEAISPSAEGGVVSTDMNACFQPWIERFDKLRLSDREAIRRHVAAGGLPSILVLVLFDTVSQGFAESSVLRLQCQLYDRWHAVLCCSESCAANLAEQLKAKTAGDNRFIVVETPRDHTTPLPLGDAPAAECTVIVSGSAMLREHALYAFAVAAADNPSAKLIYADEDRLRPDGTRFSPWFKPQFSPELLRHIPYLGRCVLLRDVNEDVSTQIGRLLSEASVVSYVTGLAQRLPLQVVAHIPFILYHDALEPQPACRDAIRPQLRDEALPTVSIIIPTKDKGDLLEACLLSIEDLTAYPRTKIEIVVVDNGSTDPTTLRILSNWVSNGRIRVLRDQQTFHYARINNSAASEASGEVLVFLNNDTQIIRRDWLLYLVNFAIQNDVGAVGVKLLYPDRTVQHGGVILGVQGVAAHAWVGLTENGGGYHNLANVVHEVSAVTGACLAMRRLVFQEIGGFDEKLAVAFNDVLLCLNALERGYRNIYIGESLLIHLESKSRGLDDTPARVRQFRREAQYARSRFIVPFKDDPHYSPNLSLERTFDLARPPRVVRPWRAFARRSGEPLRVLMLSIMHQVGHGVAVVVNLQAEYLAEKGFKVFIGGPPTGEEFAYQGCHRVHLADHLEAAAFAFDNDIDCIVAHTPPFMSTVRWLGTWPRSIIYDYGEPSPEFFLDAEARREMVAEKRFCYPMADRVFAISDSVRREIDYEKADVLRLGNSHLNAWTEAAAARRQLIRNQLGLSDEVLVLNVCRFHVAERRYKGVDMYADVADELRILRPDLRGKVLFALCGKGTESDVREVQALGLRVFANTSDAELTDLYIAADVYTNFSRWEGYNLGIGQALAFGLPVIASDIPAHREFPIWTSNDLAEICVRLAEIADTQLANGSAASRKPIIFGWDEPLARFADAISQLCQDQSNTSVESGITTRSRYWSAGKQPNVL